MKSPASLEAYSALHSSEPLETYHPVSCPGTRILIADDHILFGEALYLLLSRVPRFEVVGSIHEKDSLLPSLQEHRPDILLLDLVLAQSYAGEIKSLIAESGLTVRTILLAAYLDTLDVAKVLRLGASGVLLKESTGHTLIEAISSVMNGAAWLDLDGLAGLARQLRENGSKPSTHRAAPRRFNLTPRELDVLVCIVSGLSNADIAEHFSLSSHTVKHHISHIFDKVGVTNRLELALFALEHQLVKRQPGSAASVPQTRVSKAS